ncbi:hypothetical protein KSZ_14800 [Dictyobacter formicarum]|uniref:Uncharacterized protein n=1 Tax=Dictyobacter formicarum TaxID=2778368 RepID=A0ABQ3VBR5_9CHLR|nr:hypothetical protein KSZ_14800 [Dictyobacter formicarum]
MITFSSLLGNFIMPTQPVLAFLRDHVFLNIQRIASLRRWLSEMQVKPQPTYRAGLRFAGRYSGQLLPQPVVCTSTGQRFPLDQVLGNHFCIFRLWDEDGAATRPGNNALWSRLNAHHIYLCPTQAALKRARKLSTDAGTTYIWDGSGQLPRLLQGDPQMVMVVRPDRHIMTTYPTSQWARVEKRIARYFGQNDPITP